MKLLKSWYVPTLTAAVTKMSPPRLNQAAAQPQPLPPRMQLQWYSPPAVGNAEAICAMHKATTKQNPTPTGQTIPAAAPPTAQKPSCRDVIPPARMQMMEKEMAKLENPFILRNNSCA